MLKNIYNKMIGLVPNAAGQPYGKTPPQEPFELSLKPKPKQEPKQSCNELEKKHYEQEHFKGHEAECGFCLNECVENLDGEKLKEYIVFSEILGKPKSKRTGRF